MLHLSLFGAGDTVTFDGVLVAWAEEDIDLPHRYLKFHKASDCIQNTANQCIF